MRKVAELLTALFSTLSIVRLAQQGFNLGFATPAANCLGYYEKLTHLLFGWAEPYLVAVIHWGGWNVQLQPSWKHVLVLSWLYYGSVTKVIWPKYRSRRERALLLLLTVWGGIIGLATSVAGGAVTVNDSPSTVVMAAFPLVGFVLYQVSWAAFLATLGVQESWWNRYRAAVRLYIGPGTIGVVGLTIFLCAFADSVPLLRALRNPGLTLLFVLILFLALYWLWTGVLGAVYFIKPQDKSWWQTFRAMRWWQSWRVSSNYRIGFTMLTAIGGAALFILLGAGLE